MNFLPNFIGIHKVLDVQQRGIPVSLAIAVVLIDHVFVERTVAEISLQ